MAASVRVAEFGKATFYADSVKLLYRPCYIVIDHMKELFIFQLHRSQS